MRYVLHNINLWRYRFSIATLQVFFISMQINVDQDRSLQIKKSLFAYHMQSNMWYSLHHVISLSIYTLHCRQFYNIKFTRWVTQKKRKQINWRLPGKRSVKHWRELSEANQFEDLKKQQKKKKKKEKKSDEGKTEEPDIDNINEGGVVEPDVSQGAEAEKQKGEEDSKEDPKEEAKEEVEEEAEEEKKEKKEEKKAEIKEEIKEEITSEELAKTEKVGETSQSKEKERGDDSSKDSSKDSNLIDSLKSRISTLENENNTLINKVSHLQSRIKALEQENAALIARGDDHSEVSLSPPLQPQTRHPRRQLSFVEVDLYGDASKIKDIRKQMEQWKGWQVDMRGWRTFGIGPAFEL